MQTHSQVLYIMMKLISNNLELVLLTYTVNMYYWKKKKVLRELYKGLLEVYLIISRYYAVI